MIQMSEEANGFEDRKNDEKKKGRKEEYSAELHEWHIFSSCISFSMVFRVISFCSFFAVEILEPDM